MNPVLCMITDRSRSGGGVEALVRRVAAAAREGVHLVQIRERDLDGRAQTELAARCVEAVRGTRTRVIINDRLDVALAAGAHGVHLRGDSFAASRARVIAPPGFLIGRSIHSVAEAVEATRDGAADYLIFGTVFETASKPDRQPAGLGTLGEVVRAAPLPVLAVGGITAARIPRVMGAGAAGIAAIGLFTGV